jgi:hypothetical protein
MLRNSFNRVLLPLIGRKKQRINEREFMAVEVMAVKGFFWLSI